MVWTGLFARSLPPIILVLLSGVAFLLPFKVAHAEVIKGRPVKTPKIIHGDSDLKFLHKGTLPSVDDVPAGPKGEAIQYGFELVVHTQEHLKEYVGNSLTCQNCHLGAGRTPV